MRVLWIASSEGLFAATSERSYNGGGWIAGLQTAVNLYYNDISLGLAFLTHKKLPFKVEKDNCIYYPVNDNKSFLEKIVDRITPRDTKPHYIEYLKIIEDFKPDILHIFGVELPYSYLVGLTDIPIVVHLQGFLNPYLNAYFPPGMNENSLLQSSKKIKEILGLGFIYNYKTFKRNANKEIGVLSKCKNVMGRTLWDRQIADLMTDKACYYHVDEVLRDSFYCAEKWKYRKKNTGDIRIVSTISQTMYKGLDLIFKTVNLLERFGVKYTWDIIGVNRDSNFVKLFEKHYGFSIKEYNLNFCGRKNSEEIIDIILQSDLYVHPSYIDNSPNSVCEAQFLGIPVVACNVGGVSSLIENSRTGFLIPANSPYELSYIIKHYDEYDLETISKNEIQMAEKRHNRETIVTTLISCYQNSINLN